LTWKQSESVRIDILAIGSHGDVLPTVALGRGLQRAGHRVRIVTLGGFEDVVRSHGLDHLCIGDSPRDIAKSAAGLDWVEHRTGTIGFLRGFVRVAASMIETGIANYWPASRDAEALILTPLGIPIGVHIAERLGIPLVRISYAPTRQDWAGREHLTTALRGDVEALMVAGARLLVWSRLRNVTNMARQKILSLPPLPRREPSKAMNRRGVPLLEAYSAAVVPRPSNWGSWIHVTGYWFLEEPGGWKPPAELVRFLGAGTPPVFVGFGSTPFPGPDVATDTVVDALSRIRQRGVVVAGGSGLRTGRLTDDILSVESVPHGWLFPRVSAAVHHGGAGVTAAALRAGLPSVVVPIFGDQPFWAQRVFQLGAGPRPIPAKRLSATALAEAISRARDDETFRCQATRIGRQIRAEDGVARAVEAIQDHLATAPAARRVS